VNHDHLFSKSRVERLAILTAPADIKRSRKQLEVVNFYLVYWLVRLCPRALLFAVAFLSSKHCRREREKKMSSRQEMEDHPMKEAEGNQVVLHFDYRSVPSSVANFLKGQADRIRHQCVTSVIQIGKALLEAKRHLSHGAFLRWVEWEVGIPVRTAQAYMRTASWASGKSATIAHLSPTMLYLLSAPSTPADLVAKVLARIEGGEIVVPSMVREELKKMRLNGRARDSAPHNFVGQPPQLQMSSPPIGDNFFGGLSDLVEILLKGLSAAEFERVRQIITSDAVLCDPHLSRNLEHAFVVAPNEWPEEKVPAITES
jgi:hypothetical protein